MKDKGVGAVTEEVGYYLVLLCVDTAALIANHIVPLVEFVGFGRCRLPTCRVRFPLESRL